MIDSKRTPNTESIMHGGREVGTTQFPSTTILVRESAANSRATVQSSFVTLPIRYVRRRAEDWRAPFAHTLRPPRSKYRYWYNIALVPGKEEGLGTGVRKIYGANFSNTMHLATNLSAGKYVIEK